MFESLLAPWRAKYRLAISGTVCYAIAGVAGAIAFGFALAALFTWLSQHFGSIVASLIIAGAFGHSRLREWAFGGVTRDFLARAERCTLVSR